MSFCKQICKLAKILGLNLLSAVFLLAACENHSQQLPKGSKINPELFGTWSDDSGCILKLAPESTTIRLSSFSAAKQRTLTNLILVVKKESIFTKFSPLDKTIPFSGSFSEGIITIDNYYCKQPLHKITD